MESLLQSLIDAGITKSLIIILIAMLPIVELRGAIPIALLVFNMPWHIAVPLAIAGNLIPVPILLIAFRAISRQLYNYKVFRKALNWIDTRIRHRRGIVERHKFWGLILLVAIPLPVTGAWTGSIVSTFLGLNRKPSFLAITLGVVIAAFIVLATTLQLSRV